MSFAATFDQACLRRSRSPADVRLLSSFHVETNSAPNGWSLAQKLSEWTRAESNRCYRYAKPAFSQLNYRPQVVTATRPLSGTRLAHGLSPLVFSLAATAGFEPAICPPEHVCLGV